MGKYFGTDGIRGIVNDGLDSMLAFNVGQAAATVLARVKDNKPVVTIGKDTRISCDMLEAALFAGLCSAGANVIRLGVVPTPAVAFITKDCKADAGIVISASHNPYEHNGIKIFNGEGFKLPDELEAEIEHLVDNPELLVRKHNGDIGCSMRRGEEYVIKYVDHVVASAFGEIKDLKVIIDCSNGAASRTVNSIFRRFHIGYELIKDHPDGTNINDACGSTNTEFLRRMVVSGGFDIGIAFDGDADRCIVVDENGNEVDGDKIMGICGAYMKDRGILAQDTIVATVMSNIGFHDYVASRGIVLHCTKVGDRNVLEKMLEGGYNLGGEQSGHLIFLDDSTTGDGQMAAVKFMSVVCALGKKVSELVSEIPSYPQLLLNLPVADATMRNAIMDDDSLQKAIESEDLALGNRGRVLVRASGTEPLIRVMVEAESEEIANNSASRLANMIKKLDTALNC